MLSEKEVVHHRKTIHFMVGFACEEKIHSSLKREDTLSGCVMNLGGQQPQVLTEMTWVYF